jgi:hypothetical protein
VQSTNDQRGELQSLLPDRIGKGVGSTSDHLGPRVLEPEPRGPERVPAGRHDRLLGALIEQPQPCGSHQPHLRLGSSAAYFLPCEIHQRTQRLPSPRRLQSEGREPRGDTHHGGARQIRAAVGPRGEGVRPGASAAAVYYDREARSGGESGTPLGGDKVDERGDDEGEERGAEAEAAEAVAAAGARGGGFSGGFRHGGERPDGSPAAVDADDDVEILFIYWFLSYPWFLLKLGGTSVFIVRGRREKGVVINVYDESVNIGIINLYLR